MEQEVLSKLLDHKKITILHHLYLTKEEMYLREIAKKTNLPPSSVFRILQELNSIGLVSTRTIKTLKLYSLIKNEKTKFLDDWFKEESQLDLFIKEIKTIEGIKRVLLQGKIEKNQANVIIIGTGIDSLKIDEICNRIKEQGLDLSNVILTESQYDKLDRMGIYGGDKKLLYKNL